MFEGRAMEERPNSEEQQLLRTNCSSHTLIEAIEEEKEEEEAEEEMNE